MPFMKVTRPASGFGQTMAGASGYAPATRTFRTAYQNIGGRGWSAIDLDTGLFNALEEYVRWAEGVPRHLPYAMDTLVRFMALANLGIAQKMSAGPRDPKNMRPNLAWKIPVRRITHRYFFGWKVRRLRLGVWMLYNDSREAYFIEFGIHRDPRTGEVSPRRIRRPIRKLSLKRTLEAMMRTKAYHRIWSEIYVDKKRGKGYGFTQTVQSPGGRGMPPGQGSYSGPGLGRKLP
jgi:hypothetical protein